jgi:hypothetical protein
VLICGFHTFAYAAPQVTRVKETSKDKNFEGRQQLKPEPALHSAIFTGTVQLSAVKDLSNKLFATSPAFPFYYSKTKLPCKKTLFLPKAYIQHIYPTHFFW